MLATELIQELEEVVKSFGDREVRLFADDMPNGYHLVGTWYKDIGGFIMVCASASNGDRAPIEP